MNNNRLPVLIHIQMVIQHKAQFFINQWFTYIQATFKIPWIKYQMIQLFLL